MQDAPPTGKTQGVNSVELGFALFDELVQAKQPLVLSQLARKTGLHRAKVFRYLVSLVRSGWVMQDDQTGAYRVGDKGRAFALQWLAGEDQLQWAFAEAETLARETSETCFVAAWLNGNATAVKVFQPERVVAITVQEGALLNTQTSATGRTFAAWKKAGKKLSHSAMHQSIRETGLSAVEGDHMAGINALSAPVFDARGDIQWVLTLVGPASSLTPRKDSAQARALQATCRKLSQSLPISRGSTDD